jgi:hypothetical protein
MERLFEAYIYMKGEQDVMAMYAGRFQEAITGVKDAWRSKRNYRRISHWKSYKG